MQTLQSMRSRSWKDSRRKNKPPAGIGKGRGRQSPRPFSLAFSLAFLVFIKHFCVLDNGGGSAICCQRKNPVTIDKSRDIARNPAISMTAGFLVIWRRWRDSNSRRAFDPYTISNRARSTSYATSPRTARTTYFIGARI